MTVSLELCRIGEAVLQTVHFANIVLPPTRSKNTEGKNHFLNFKKKIYSWYTASPILIKEHSRANW